MKWAQRLTLGDLGFWICGMAESHEPDDLSMATFIKRNPKYEQAFEQRGQVQEMFSNNMSCIDL